MIDEMKPVGRVDWRYKMIRLTEDNIFRVAEAHGVEVAPQHRGWLLTVGGRKVYSGTGDYLVVTPFGKVQVYSEDYMDAHFVVTQETWAWG